MEWLSQILESLCDWLPRVWIIQPDEAGVIVTLGKRIKKVGPGWYLGWPKIQDCSYVTVTPGVIDLRVQSLMTQDKQDVMISGAIKRKIRDAEAAILRVENFDTSLQTLALGVINKYVKGVPLSNLIAHTGTLTTLIQKELQKSARGMGVEIMAVYITDLGTVRNYRVAGGNVAPIGEDE
jgi:regulator of protease activity HflC (stomatin/prohibitin superfamily)